MCFSLYLYEWYSFKWGYGRPMIEGEKDFFENFFTENPFIKIFFILVWYELSMGVHTNDDGNKNYF